MYFKYIYSFFILCFALAITDLAAQTTPANKNTQVNQLSDQQILQIWKDFQSSGLSETQATQVLIRQGYSATDVDSFKQRLAMLQGKGTAGVGKTSEARVDSITFTRDTTKIINPPLLKRQSPIYGYDWFSNPELKFEPNLRIATPQNYILGPEDQLILLLTGLNERTFKSTISPEGILQIPGAGLVSLNGVTIERARSLIRSKMLGIYPALASGRTQLTVNLGNPRTIRVMITGEVLKPGTYTLSSLSSLYNALYLSGGPSDRGSLRNVRIIRGNKILNTVDFYPWLQSGMLNENIRLEDQDVILIPVYTKRVTINGEVKRPGLYELRENETLENLITYAGGFSDIAYKSIAKVVEIGDKERSFRDVSSDMFSRFLPKNADLIYFEPVSGRFSNRIILEGAVYRPGVYELTQNLSLSQLIRKADGLRDDAFLSKGYIKRTKPDLEKVFLSFDLNQVLSGANDHILMREDSIMIYSNNDLKENLTVSIDGFVKYPGTFIYRTGLKASDIIQMAGGFTNDAASHRVQVSRLERNFADTLSNKLITVISLDIDSTFKQPFLLEPLDNIYVPKLVNSVAIANIKINGEVLRPGDYALQRRDETVPELIKMAGGLTPYGSLANTQIYRNGIRVEMDLTGKKTRQDERSLILMPGDSIIIPRENPFVAVNGAVNTPQLLRYTGRNFKYYINAAGGTKENGNLKGAYIQYANGINQPVRHVLFFRNYPGVEAGSKIFVPEKSRLHIGFGEIPAITSALTALVSLIVILTK